MSSFLLEKVTSILYIQWDINASIYSTYIHVWSVMITNFYYLVCLIRKINISSYSFPLTTKSVTCVWLCCVCVHVLSCVRLCDSVDCSLPGFFVHGLLQARILEWVGYSLYPFTTLLNLLFKEQKTRQYSFIQRTLKGGLLWVSRLVSPGVIRLKIELYPEGLM